MEQEKERLWKNRRGRLGTFSRTGERNWELSVKREDRRSVKLEGRNRELCKKERGGTGISNEEGMNRVLQEEEKRRNVTFERTEGTRNFWKKK